MNRTSNFRFSQRKFSKLLSPFQSYLKSTENSNESQVTSINFSRQKPNSKPLKCDTSHLLFRNQMLDALSPIKRSYMKFKQHTRESLKPLLSTAPSR